MIAGMNPLTGLIRMNRRYDGITLGVLLKLGGFLGLTASVRPLLLRLVVGMRLFVVVATLAAEEEQNLLSVGTTHTDSFRSWWRAVKRTTLLRGGAHASRA